jgi:hypothetical protein
VHGCGLGRPLPNLIKLACTGSRPLQLPTSNQRTFFTTLSGILRGPLLPTVEVGRLNLRYLVPSILSTPLGFSLVTHRHIAVGRNWDCASRWVTATRLVIKVDAVGIATVYLPMLTLFGTILGRSRDGLYEPVLADSEREAVADLLQYLENVGVWIIRSSISRC